MAVEISQDSNIWLVKRFSAGDWHFYFFAVLFNMLIPALSS
jgi:hypothetical protein